MVDDVIKATTKLKVVVIWMAAVLIVATSMTYVLGILSDLGLSYDEPTGSSQTDGIQEAIDNLPASGGAIYLDYREYDLEVPIDVDEDNIKIFGDGTSTVLTPENNLYSFFNVTGDNFEISDLRLDGTGYTVDRAIDADQADYLKITEITITDCELGLVVVDSDFVDIANSMFRDLGDDCIWMSGCTENPEIHENQFLDSGGDGLNITSSHDIFISDNHFENLTGNSIHLDNVAQPSIICNLFDDSFTANTACIDCSAGNIRSLVVSGNIFDHARVAIALDQTYESVITGNQFRESTMRGIVFTSDEATSFGITISGNYFFLAGSDPDKYNILFNGDAETININGNTFGEGIPMAGSNSMGIGTVGSITLQNITIASNIFQKCYDVPIDLSNSTNYMISITDNQIIGSPVMGGPAIHLANANQVNLVGNNINDTTNKMTYGILIEATSDYILILGNTITGFVTAAVSVTATNVESAHNLV